MLIEWLTDHDDAAAHAKNRFMPMVDTFNNTYRALRILSPDRGNLVYTEFADLRSNYFWTKPPLEYEYYDLDKDPFQLHNVYSSLSAAEKTELHEQLDQLWHCQGENCN